MKTGNVAILCSACGEDTFVRREPVYEGFRKTGERILCVSCGHEFADAESVPYKRTDKPRVFSEEDLPAKPDIFKSDEKGRNCRHCRHYVVNPFIQRCGLHHQEVHATDLCDRFSALEEVQESNGK